MFQFSTPPPLTLYIHMPWCMRKCPYCDFNSHEPREDIPQRAYVDALVRDLEQDLPRVWGRRAHAIYIGGGTPSLFAPEHIAALLSAVRARLAVQPEAEITLEANPGTVDVARFRGFREAGINRLSLGIQSLNDAHLQRLGRIHNREQAVRAVAAARAAGFDNLNLDLMFGLPAQTPEQAVADLRAAIALQPSHVSLYQLTIEPNTRFHAQPPTLPDDEAVWAMQSRLQALLADSGYRQYEVSAYAQAGAQGDQHQCRHNLNYWRFGDYLGIGAGAHGKLSDHQGITRLWKQKHPKAYLGAAGTAQGIGGEHRLTPQDAGLEFMMNALRLSDGVPAALFPERTGLPISTILKPLQAAEARGLLAWDVHCIKPTTTGKRFLNDLLQLFVPD